MSENEITVPDLVGYVLGWRRFNVALTGHLMSSHTAAVWDAGPNHARCRYVGHPAPERDCSCGLYATHDPSEAYGGPVLGLVKAWGKIAVHNAGFRAEHAEIVCLVGNDDEPEADLVLVDRYDVPVFGGNTPLDKAATYASQFGDFVPERLRPSLERPERYEVPGGPQALAGSGGSTHSPRDLPDRTSALGVAFTAAVGLTVSAFWATIVWMAFG